MTEPVSSPGGEVLDALDHASLGPWIEQQRWFASKSRHVSAIEIEESAVLAQSPPLVLALVQTRFSTGSHELYQLPLALMPAGHAGGLPAVADAGESVVVDAVRDPELVRELLRHIDSESTLETEDGCLRFQRADGGGPIAVDAPARPIGVEQSNSSIVFGDDTVLKLFRKLEPGTNPELEILRFLAARGFEHIAPLQGWYEYEGSGFSATLGVAQRFFDQAVGGWELALEQIRSDPAAFLVALGGLGMVTAKLHNALAADSGNPSFAPEEPSAEALALLTATIDEDIERVFSRLPQDDRVSAIAGRGQDIRERVTQRGLLGLGGRAIRTHGDFHLGQTLRVHDGWLILDFEGEPARPLFERRMKASPLRDVAGMLRSFAYATSAIAIIYGQPAPATLEDQARQVFLEHYMSTIDPALLPAGDAAVANLLSIFELEKAIYELQYELDNRPDWLSIPVAGIARLLEAE